jgi:hypothetical protein
MSASITNNLGKVLTVKVSGRLTQPELVSAQKEALRILQKEGNKRLLIMVEDFEGWGKGYWGDISGQISMEPFIERMAVVGDKKWEGLALLFLGKGIRRLAIEYFPPSDLAKAQEWVTQE